MARVDRRPDPIRLIEAAYACEVDESRWLAELTRRAAPFGVGGGVIVCTVKVGRHVNLGPVHRSDETRDRDVVALQRFAERLPPPIARDAFAPTEHVVNATHRLARLAHDAGLSADAFLRVERARLPAIWWVIGGDPARRAVVLCFPRGAASRSSSDEPFPHRDRHTLGLVGPHLGSALRLRTLLRPPPDASVTDAVTTPENELPNTHEPANAERARRSLVEAVLSSALAHRRVRRVAPDDALRSWAALVEGRWTILDTAENNGRRLLLARANPLQTASVLELTPDERHVVWLAALGHSYKYIAYELGYPLSTIASRLRRATHKLRARSRAELLTRMSYSTMLPDAQ